MKANAPRRKIFDDAIDVLTGPQAGETGSAFVVQEIPIDKIDPFRDHPFRLYEGERLEDMIDSVRTHGVLTPVIVRKVKDRYEMLAGHNRTNAAKLAGLTTVPAIVKEDISDEDAYVYVVETNLMQRSFSDFLPSEKAVILKTRYETMKCQGKRNDILREIAALQSGESTSGQIVQKLDSRDAFGQEYNLNGRNVARIMRINYLIPSLKQLVDTDQIPMSAAITLSFLPESAQGWIYDASEEYKFRLNMKTAKRFRDEADKLTEARVREIAEELTKKDKVPTTYQKVMLPKIVYKKYFTGMEDHKVQAIVQLAIEQYFKNV